DRIDAPMAGASDRIDINDLRLFAGLEWNQVNMRRGFIEIGYVFDRELTYKLVPAETIDLDDSLMLRGGISF
ncbi:MAG: hypothetical protein KDA60_23010, partial [Planctomycetales bacterium]|nr:hypothetical protein [Planctomycetales bacterium]